MIPAPISISSRKVVPVVWRLSKRFRSSLETRKDTTGFLASYRVFAFSFLVLLAVIGIKSERYRLRDRLLFVYEHRLRWVLGILRAHVPVTVPSCMCSEGLDGVIDIHFACALMHPPWRDIRNRITIQRGRLQSLNVVPRTVLRVRSRMRNRGSLRQKMRGRLSPLRRQHGVAG